MAARINVRGEGFHCHVEYCTTRWRARAGVIGEIVAGERIDAKLMPCDQVYSWRLTYAPDGTRGGTLNFSLDNQTGTCAVVSKHLGENATFTHSLHWWGRLTPTGYRPGNFSNYDSVQAASAVPK